MVRVGVTGDCRAQLVIIVLDSRLCRYCSELLLWLVSSMAGNVPDAQLAQLQVSGKYPRHDRCTANVQASVFHASPLSVFSLLLGQFIIHFLPILLVWLEPQDSIQECDKAGGRDKNVPAGEEVEVSRETRRGAGSMQCQAGQQKFVLKEGETQERADLAYISQYTSLPSDLRVVPALQLFAQLAASCSSKEDVDQLVLPLCTGK